MKVGSFKGLTEVDAMPSQPPGGPVEVQSPIVAACDVPLPDDGSLLLPGLVSPVGGVVELVELVAPLPGCWHCHEGSGAQESPIC